MVSLTDRSKTKTHKEYTDKSCNLKQHTERQTEGPTGLEKFVSEISRPASSARVTGARGPGPLTMAYPRICFGCTPKSLGSEYKHSTQAGFLIVARGAMRQ